MLRRLASAGEEGSGERVAGGAVKRKRRPAKGEFL